MHPRRSSRPSLISTLILVLSSHQRSGIYTLPVAMQSGVFQGDPMSPIIFNTVISTLSDTLRTQSHCGYSISGSSLKTNVLLYADDICLVADGPASGQHLLSTVEQWLHWSGMLAKIPKCCSMAIKSSSAVQYDPGLQLGGQAIPINHSSFLVVPFQFQMGDIIIRLSCSLS